MRGLGELTPEQRQLFDRLLAQTNDHRLRPRPSGETPLSYAQERIYFLEQLGPQSTAYTVAWGFDVVGPLDCGCLKEAFRRLRDRHEILRARCVKTSTGARLEFEPPGPVEVLELDLRGLARDEVTTRATELIRAPFELTAGSLSRLSLIRVGPDEHVLLLHSHHLIVDSWSAKVILRELGSVYAALVQAREPALEPLPLSYSDFAFWQRQRQQNWAQEIAYWKEALAGAPTCLTLPTDHSRPAFRSYRGQKHHFRVDSALADQLAESARQGGVTLFSLLLALFGAYLGRLSGQSEVVIGAALSDRFPAETEAMVGSFAHLLPLLCGCGPDETLADLLPRVRQTVAGALAHKEVPFERLVDELAPPRNLDHDPIFQVMFVLHEDPLEEELHLLGCQVRRRVLEKGGSRFDLMLEMVDGENELFGWFEYSLDLFEPATIAAMTEQFWLLVAGALAAPEAPLADLPLVPPSQPEPSLGPALAIDPEVRVESLIASQAALRPEQLAVDQLTYAQLAEQVQVRAASLLSQGLAAGQLVSLSSYKNSQLLVSMLAVWRCQASFLPLGPDWPARRRQAVVAASGCHWQWEQEVWRAGPGGSPFDSSRAYAMATSGSSGLPKVVAVSHRSLANLLLSMADEPGFGPDDSLLSVTTPTFDIALLEFFLPLVAGGSVQLLPDEIRGGCGLRQALERGQPSVVQATPTMWRMLLETGWRPTNGLKILCGGEGLSRQLAGQLLGADSLWNLYGPTETTVWSTLHRVQSADREPPIGRPIANTRIEIRDDRGRPVPRGVVGEICISGLGVAQAYLGGDELAREGFYHTGDLGCWDRHGQLHFAGRRDQQVKVRGVRIELAEVEHALLGHPGISSAAVVARQDELVAFLVGDPAPANVLQAYLRGRLPEAFVPSTFHFLEKFPTTANGKLDRRALDATGGPPAPAGSTYRAPQTPTEARVVELYEATLQRQPVGCEHDFFALGGHSLLAISLASRLETAFELTFPLRKVFELGTPARVAGWLEQQILLEIEAMSEEEASHLAFGHG